MSGKAKKPREKRARSPDSPETRRRKNARAKDRRDAKRGGPPLSPQERGHVENPKIYSALYNAGKSKQFAAAASNAHPSLTGKDREQYIKMKKGQTEDPSKYKKKRK